MANPDQVKSAIKPVLDAECGWLFKCCTAGELAQSLGPATSDDCTDHLFRTATVSFPYGLTNDDATTNLLVALNYVQYDFDQGSIKVDSAAVTACAAAISAKDCNAAPPADHCAPVAPSADDACAVDKLLVGSLPEGADCSAQNGANPCAPGFICRSVTNGGVCIAAPAVGDLCLRDDDCGAALLCDWTSGKCVAGKNYGEKCAFSDPDHPVIGTESTRCANNLLCDATTLKCADPKCATGTSCTQDAQCPKGVGCVMSSCGPLRKAGQTCNQPSDCDSGTCSYDSAAQRQLCSAPKAEGSQCNQASDCASGFCQYDQTAMQQVCKPTVKTGQMCVQSEQCQSGKCGTDGTCAAVAAGDACTTDTDCAISQNLFCVDAKCLAAPFANGTACSSGQQCQSETCVAGTCVDKGAVGDACGASSDAPCDLNEYCAIPDGKSVGKCAAQKSAGEPCSSDAECAGGCQTANGELRCAGEPPGAAACSGM